MLFDKSRDGNMSSHEATWRIRLNLCILRPTHVHNRNGQWIGSAVFAELTAESAHTLQWAPLSASIVLSHGGSGPHVTRCFGPMRAHKPKGTSIGSAVFAQMTAKCPYTLQWFACPPAPAQNCPFLCWHLDLM